MKGTAMGRSKVGDGSSESIQIVVSTETRKRIDRMVHRFGWHSRSELLRALLVAFTEQQVRIIRGPDKLLIATAREGSCKTRTKKKE